jgi:tetratricopeptide (TPR) repeat protein
MTATTHRVLKEVGPVTTTAPTTQGETAEGLRLHRSGDLPGAVRLYEAALARDPADADASCLLGVAHQEQGRPEQAVEWIERAVAIRPDVPAYHASLGLAWQALGRPAEAAAAFARVLELNPDDAAAHVNRGVVVLALRDREAALAHFRRAVELAPRLAQARTNLGELLRELGRPDEALPHCQAAVALEPALVEAHLNLGDVLLALGRPGPAVGSYHEAHQRDPNRARAAAGIGLVAVRQGAWSDALDWLRRAVELEPRSVEFLRYLAEAAGMLALYPEVRSCCERILELDPDHAVAHNALAWILQDAGRHGESREHYAAAVRLQPDFATAHFNFGVLHEELGELADAEARYRSTLACEPTHATALARLCSLLRESLPDADLDAVNRLLSRSDVIGRDRANLLFGLALVHDARGRYPDAAACVERANALALDELVRQGRAYEPDEHRRFVDAMIAAFSPELFGRLERSGLETTRPVFIVGLPRSGTTLIEQVLASHPEVHGAGEVTLARRSFEELPGLVGGSGHSLHAVPRLDAATVQELARRHERRLAELDGGRARRVIGKMPDNYFYLGLIALMFPRAAVIHCRRDLRDVALSCWFTNFTDVQWANDHDHIASRIEAYGRLMDHWRGALPSGFTIHDVAYEEAVADLEGTARRLLNAMDLGWDPACLEFHRSRRPVRTASQVQVRKPVYRGSVGRWKLYEDELAGLFASVESQAGIRSERQVAE